MDNANSTSNKSARKKINSRAGKRNLINSSQNPETPEIPPDIFPHNRREFLRRKAAANADALAEGVPAPDLRFTPVLGASGRYPDVRLAEWVAAREAIHGASLATPDESDLSRVIDRPTIERHAGRRHAHHRMSAAMAAAADALATSGDLSYLHTPEDLQRLARQLDTCRADGAAGVAGFSDGSIGRVKIWDAKCNSALFCAFEATKAGVRLHEKYAPEILHHIERGQHAYFAVLTLPNTPTGDHQSLRLAIDEGFQRVRTWIDELAIIGAVTVCECPLSRDGNSWNLHYNVFFLSPEYLDYGNAREAWGYNAEFVGAKKMLEIAQRRESRNAAVEGRAPEPVSTADAVASAFKELSKYAAKVVGTCNAAGDDSDNPISAWPWRRLCEWMSAWKGLRRVRTTGVLNCVARRRWRRAQYARRVEWCKFAGVAVDCAHCRWLQLDDVVVRDKLALAMVGRRRRRMVDFCSHARIVDAGGRIRVTVRDEEVLSIDLIQGNNFSGRGRGSRWKKYAGGASRAHPGTDPPSFESWELPF